MFGRLPSPFDCVFWALPFWVAGTPKGKPAIFGGNPLGNHRSGYMHHSLFGAVLRGQNGNVRTLQMVGLLLVSQTHDPEQLLGSLC